MDPFEVVGHPFHGDVPTAIVAGGDRWVAFRAVKRATVEELLEAFAVGCGCPVSREGNIHGRFALLAGPFVLGGDDRLVVIVNPARHDAGPGTEWAVHAELAENRFTDEIAFIRQVVQELGKLLFDFEGDDFRFGRFPGHGSTSFFPPLYRFKIPSNRLISRRPGSGWVS